MTVTDDGDVWTTSGAVHKYLKEKEVITRNEVGLVLNKIGRARKGGPGATGRSRSVKLNLQVLLSHAEEHGIACPMLVQLMDPVEVARIQKKAGRK